MEATHRYIQSSSVNPLVLLCDKWRKDYDEHFQKLNKWLVSYQRCYVVHEITGMCSEALIGQLLKGVGEIRDVFHRERKQGRKLQQMTNTCISNRPMTVPKSGTVVSLTVSNTSIYPNHSNTGHSQIILPQFLLEGLLGL